MTQETAKIELSNEEDTLEMIAIAYGAPMNSAEFMSEVGDLLENSQKYHGKFNLAISTDKLSVEKLQEQLNTAKKALTEISKDVEYFYTPDKSVFLPSGVAQIAIDALAAIEGGEGERLDN